MHIGTAEIQTYTRVLEAVTLAHGIANQIKAVLRNARPDATGSLHLSDGRTEITLRLDRADGAPRWFESLVLEDIHTGSQTIRKGTRSHFEMDDNRQQIFVSESPTAAGPPQVTTVEFDAQGAMSLNGEIIGAHDQDIYKSIVTANGLSSLVAQMMNQVAALAGNPGNQDQRPGCVKFADEEAVLQLVSDPSSKSTQSFEATFLKDKGAVHEGGIPAGTHLSWHRGAQGPTIRCQAPGPEGTRVVQELRVNADGSVDFKMFVESPGPDKKESTVGS